ncbi:MAG TPA: bifunctional hydroxymethylpyrimidine kinase/phosphomethylpyrimidine kinase [Candidatus Hydrogenedentes bacterium]|nr:bifunctional hydroxymethylpyrimidine kinase/phosphomethylpyrimidine kinase [Candidatus Hydrogenedentota bacterium]HPG68481.1 bifunctional hydroxymethylpyrimidine kinase/phosphomethylpyrimidine kinase [Candidatus Hydrogenedentota bacterium]
MTDALPPRVLTIAGSDSGGGAGIEADLKTFTVLGVYGMAAITAVTAQNTTEVRAIHDVPADIVAQQIDAVAEDIGIDAAKTGMLSNAAIVEAVAEAVARNGIETLVVDPVMISKSGAALLKPEAQSALIEALVPRAFMITPNIPEAEVMAGIAIADEAGARNAAERILALGPRYVLIKGGHLGGNEVVDYLIGGDTAQVYRAPRIDTPNTHGTGCTLSAAIAAFLAKGYPAAEAVERARGFLIEAIRRSLPLGHGHGPLNHLWPLS